LGTQAGELPVFDPQEDVVNSAALMSAFGSWPSFHDAEVASIVLRRGPQKPSLECVIHVFEMTSDVDERGNFVLRNHVLVTLRFDDIVLNRLDGFNHQNAIDGLSIRRSEHGDGRFSVEIPPNYGCDVSLTCGSIEVAGVEPWLG
jgi:hypothetical protein